jgi:Laminin G domain
MSSLRLLIVALATSIHSGILVLVAIAGLVAAPPPSPARLTNLHTIASWQMNEPSGATVMHGRSGPSSDGSIGSAVSTGVRYKGATVYRFGYVPRTQSPAQPQRLVTVHKAALNPGTEDFAVTIRYRSSHVGGNLIQKGQSQSSGGFFKIEQPDGSGNLNCVFRGPLGSVAVGSGRPLDNGHWHTIRCERTFTSLTLTVDGVRTDSTYGSTGNITNSMPLTIGGKLNCNTTQTCDYFAGDIDFITIQVGQR